MVTDTGHGIPPETLQHIFQPAFTTKDVGKGTGLGLSVIRDLVTRVGGTISAHSQLGVGTTFNATQNATVAGGAGVDTLTNALARAAQDSKEVVVIISADAAATHQSVINVMDAARRAGLVQITFATQQGNTGRPRTRP